MSTPESSSKPSPSKRRGEPDEEAPRGVPGGIWLLAFVVLFLVLIYAMWKDALPSEEITYLRLWEQAKQGNLKKVEFRGRHVIGEWNQAPASEKEPGKQLPSKFYSTIPFADDHALLELLRSQGVVISSEWNDPNSIQAGLFWSLLPLLLMVLMLWVIMRRNSDPMQSGMFGNFIRSPARRFKASDHETTFADVAAMEHAKGELQEIVEFLKHPEKFQKLGAQIPKGVLLMGPPGTGKTLLARATAGEAGVPFFTINGSEFIQMFVGVGASRVRDLFQNAKDHSPCMLFIDEIDAVGRIRGAGLGGGHDEREQTLNQILSEMDGFQQSEAVIVVAATNRPDVLDPALLRPGRFDRHVTVDRPTKEGREAILGVHVRKVPLDDSVNLNKIAAGTIGFSGAELKNLVNEAALHAARNDQSKVTAKDFDEARDKVLMGAEREETLSDHEREMTAYHEAGHALLAWRLPDVDPVHKVTIIPRGRALGVTQLMPAEERYNMGEHRLHSQLAFMLGGRAAEKLVFDEFSAGAEDDLKRATSIARRMVAYWGMSTIVGPAAFRQGEEHPFLGKEMHEQRNFSEETARVIDKEVQSFLNQAADRAMKLLSDHRAELDALSNALLDSESLDFDQISAIIGAPQPRSTAVPKRVNA